MIFYGLLFAIIPIAIIVSIAIPALTPPNIENSEPSEKLEEKIEKSMKIEKCLEEVHSEVYDLYSYSRAIKFSNPSGAKVVMNEAKNALKEGVKRCKEDR